ncbi:transcription antitermination factor NusB [Formosa algae]|uniref:N utilization substance protein B n=1 Tax=Formosa algae TaxID=225843 RepID=A0A9X0YMS9_9FLAO|nr:transcription antitermination factor NusB [Formosa algae]MBP1839783.1 N utilization substance protein B [Formosa algae]MDQ0335382.1 N utilization substance protein B [Formosa algae]
MLNRRHIRVKVMQTIYAFKGGESGDFKNDQKFLLNSLDDMYHLYLLQLSLLIEVQKRVENHLDKSQLKHLATSEDKDPNRKLANNEVLQLLKQNNLLKDTIRTYGVDNWELDNEYVEVIYKAIITSDLYKEYMETRTSDFKADKHFIVDVFKEIIAPNEKLYDYLEDKNLTWLDDLPTVNTAILKLLRKSKPNVSDAYFVPKLYKDLDDKEFATSLFKKTILNTTKLNAEIDNKAKNWEAERIAQIDYILMQMAVCELQKFPSIPVKVTINEYLEIAKEYSTPKSSIFINGILDKIVKEYQEKGTLNKVGRGLM